MLIVIEGQDATGKDTQAQKLCAYLEQKGQKVVHYSESGTASELESVRKIAKINYGQDFNLEARTRVLLYLCNRYEQWQKITIPCLRDGGTVVLSRSWISTLIYEGYGSGVSRNVIARLHREIMPESYFHPDKSVIFTISDEERKKRLIAQGKRSAEFFKSKDADFQRKINQAYLRVAKDYHIPTLDVSGTVDEVFARLLAFWEL